MTAPTLSRRERLRLQTLDEIKQHALAQVAEGGGAALSLNAVGKAMGMSGPAIYRYFASREELLAALVTDGYAELAAAIVDSAAAASRRAPARRLAAVAHAYRAWALANPYRYELLFGIRPAGYQDPSEAIVALDGAMRTLLELIGAVAGDSAPAALRGRLDEQLVRWTRRRAEENAAHLAAAGGGAAGDGAAAVSGAAAASDALVSGDPDPRVLRLGVLTWTRLHGIIGLELAGVTADMGLDGRLLIDAEIDAIVAAAVRRR
jgi:AcrR family transcriptional regulator